VTEWSCPTCNRTVTVDGNHLDEVVAIAAVTDRHQRAHRAAEKVRGRPAPPGASERASRPTGTGQTRSGDPGDDAHPGKGTVA
jgi:hypothetical protein